MNDEFGASRRSVLLTFRAENVRSFRDEFELSLVRSGQLDDEHVWHVDWRIGGQPVRISPLAAILGANASGKTNALRAMSDMRNHVVKSFRVLSPSGAIPRKPFLLDSESPERPSRFEIELVLDGIQHIYGFRIDSETVLDEWAYRFPHGRSAELFVRHNMEFHFGSTTSSKLKPVREIVRPNSLFLSAAGSANNEVLRPLYEWFVSNLRIAESANRNDRQMFSTNMLDDSPKREAALSLLRAADLGVVGVNKHEPDAELKAKIGKVMRVLNDDEEDDDSVSVEAMRFALEHQAGSSSCELDSYDESLGTLIWLGLVGPVIEAMSTGSVLLVDELDASLHPALVSRLIALFDDPDTNPLRAQLIFNTHDVTVLGDSADPRLIERDQIWFTEKESDGSSRMYALSDFSPRKNEAIARRYLAGRYGGVPILSDSQFRDATEQFASIPED